MLTQHLTLCCTALLGFAHIFASACCKTRPYKILTSSDLYCDVALGLAPFLYLQLLLTAHAHDSKDTAVELLSVTGSPTTSHETVLVQKLPIKSCIDTRCKCPLPVVQGCAF